MKKRSFKTQLIVLSAAVVTAALVQSCGSSSSAPVPLAQTCGVNMYGQSTCMNNALSGPLSGALYQACQPGGIQAANMALSGSGAQITQASLQTSTDGSSVCQVDLMQEAQGEGPRAFLGPLAGTSQGELSGVTLAAYDSAIITASGSWSSGFFSSFSGCSGSSIAAGGVYCYVAGVNLFPLGSGVINVPPNGGGPLLIGLNQASGSSGCMALQLQAQIQRCVDTTGQIHPCPSAI